MNRPLRWILVLGLLPILGLSGCALLGWAANVAAPQGGFKARYAGLAGQRVAVMTWADRATDWQYPVMGADVRSAISRTVFNTLKSQATAEELKDTYFIDPRETRKWQKNHPELEGRSLTEVAPKVAAAVGASRVIYIELSQFMTRDPQTEILLRGSATANVRVAEVNGPVARIAYEEAGLTTQFPEKASEGIATSESVTEEYVFRGLIDRLGWEVSSRFFSYLGQ